MLYTILWIALLVYIYIQLYSKNLYNTLNALLNLKASSHCTFKYEDNKIQAWQPNLLP